RSSSYTLPEELTTDYTDNTDKKFRIGKWIRPRNQVNYRPRFFYPCYPCNPWFNSHRNTEAGSRRMTRRRLIIAEAKTIRAAARPVPNGIGQAMKLAGGRPRLRSCNVTSSMNAVPSPRPIA